MDVNPFFENDIFIFDLDNTLYNENDFLIRTYRKFAYNLRMNVACDSAMLFDWLCIRYQLKNRKDIFQELIEMFNISLDQNQLLDIYRASFTTDRLHTYNFVPQLFEKLLSNGKTIMILTNGYPPQQRIKITSLGLDISDIHIIYANEIAPKPSPILAEYLMTQIPTHSNGVVFIGDSEIDEQFAKRANLKFFNVLELPLILCKNLF
jgi:putative hydrolase of the HAD superfamily